jgi:hypothetical protein
MNDTSLPPFHGRFEGYSKLYRALSLFLSGTAIVFLVGFSKLNPHGPANLVLIASLVLLIFLGLFQYLVLFRRLGVRIAEGDSQANFLDKARMDISVIAQTFSIAILILAVQIAILATR